MTEKCPLRIENPFSGRQRFANCIKKECAWFIPESGRCCFHDLADVLIKIMDYQKVRLRG